MVENQKVHIFLFVALLRLGNLYQTELNLSAMTSWVNLVAGKLLLRHESEKQTVRPG